MKTALPILIACVVFGSGCTVISYDRAFPKLDWYWSQEAKAQRADRAQLKLWQQESETNANRLPK